MIEADLRSCLLHIVLTLHVPSTERTKCMLYMHLNAMIYTCYKLSAAICYLHNEMVEPEGIPHTHDLTFEKI